MLVDRQKIIMLAKTVLTIESQAIAALLDRVDGAFINACRLILACKGRVVVTGIGKSGHISKKVAATMASTGTPTFFLHSAEALHGDLGMLTRDDVLLALSYSGETEEVLQILPLVKRLGIPIISLTGKPSSTLAKFADVHLDVSIQMEACPLGLAPTASTTATLAMGDALALAVLEARGFTAEDFAKSHPAGRLGKRLLKIEDVMRQEEAIPRISEDALLSDAVMEMTQKRLGFTTVVAATDPTSLVGIFTDGDLRRTFARGFPLQTPIIEIMTSPCKSITMGTLASEAIHMMETMKSFVLPVLNEEGKLVGALNMHDLLGAGVL